MFLSWHGFSPKKRKHLKAPRIKATRDISIVIPVKNNQKGIELFLENFFKITQSESLPLEILVVSNPSFPIHVPEKYLNRSVNIKVLQCDKIGPACARNFGWENAKGDWILFTDSDCIPTSTWLEGHMDAWNGSIGYAGYVSSLNHDVVSRYYESQGILVPSGHVQENAQCPDYLITANALVWKRALVEIGGFNERIRIAAGEDIDLGFRLREIGELSFAPKSVVYHNFDDGLVGFIKRFKRYGKGNRFLSQAYSANMRPRVFKPREKTLTNFLLAYAQYLSLFWGYHFG